MPDAPLSTGKLPAGLLADLLRSVPAGDSAVQLGPAVGEDAAALEVAGDTLVVATDPITLTSSAAGRFAVIINANDVAVTGASPRWFLVTMLLPPGTDADQVRALFAEVTAALDELGATLVGGHTEVTAAVSQPVLVGQMLGVLGDRRLVTTGGARVGDELLQIGQVPVEGAAVLAAEHPDRLATLADGHLEVAARADAEPGISVVAPALLAADLGATAMHDPTEGGLAAGLHELAQASGVGLELAADTVDWFAPGIAVCRALGADPWATLASGCLVATFPHHLAEGAVVELHAAGHRAARSGRVVADADVLVDGAPLRAPTRDEVARLAERGS
jgi:hydrogenase expression/formation protein HypE